jgi:cysteinyl-tRNA synthetase
LEPTVQPRATDHIEGMKAIIERLIARGVAYVAEEHVLFNVPAMAALSGVPRYGALARRTLDDMLAGARVDVAPYKRDAMDFVLWKPSRAAHEPGWPSPAGIATPGRPGWHIECSAMSMAELLEPFGGGLTCDDPTKNVFDIHGGGIDLTFPHHENEVAQSCCAFGTEVMANVWMHNGFLQVEGEKMSKSLGNFVTIDELLNTEKFGGNFWDGNVLRYAMLQTNYRQPIDWTVTRLEAAEGTLLDWSLWRSDIEQDKASRIDFDDSSRADAEFVAALSDDLNTPKAIARLHVLANQARIEGDVAKTQAFFSSLALIGISHLPKSEKVGIDNEISTMVELLIEARLAARRAKNFAESDRIRDELLAKGIQLKDGKDPVTGEPITTWEMKR